MSARASMLLAATGAAALAVAGCGTIAFDVSQSVPEETVQGSPLGGLLPSFLPQPFPFTIDVKSETQKRDTGPARSASLKSIQFQATPHGSASGTFDFVDEIHIRVSAPAGPSMPTLEIARTQPVPKGLTTLELDVVPGIDLLPYINAGATLSATATGRQPAKTFTYDGVVIVTVHI